jgi:hypothetical protein
MAFEKLSLIGKVRLSGEGAVRTGTYKLSSRWFTALELEDKIKWKLGW